VITKSGSSPATTRRISRPSTVRPVRRTLPRSSTSRATGSPAADSTSSKAMPYSRISFLAWRLSLIPASILTAMTAAVPRGHLAPRIIYGRALAYCENDTWGARAFAPMARQAQRSRPRPTIRTLRGGDRIIAVCRHFPWARLVSNQRPLACEAIPHPTRKRPFCLQIGHMEFERRNSTFTEFACVSREFGPLEPASGPFGNAHRARFATLTNVRK